MAAARRVYLYGIALVALFMLASGLASLLGTLLMTVAEILGGVAVTLGDSSRREQVSFGVAAVVLGLLVWLVHWGLAQRAASRPDDAGAAERRAPLRRLYLYLVLGSGALIVLFAASAVVHDGLRLLLGLRTAGDVRAGTLLEPLATLLVWALFVAYHWRVAAADRLAWPEIGASATLRRWGVYVLAFVGLMVVLFTATALLGVLWEVVVPGSADVSDRRWMIAAVVDRVGWLASGLVLWLTVWTWSLQLQARDDLPDPERRSVLRKVYLYLVLGVCVAWTVWSLGRVLYLLLRVPLAGALGVGGSLAETTWGGVVVELGPAAAAVLVFGTGWLYHARVLQREAAKTEALPAQTAVRWWYGYLVAVVGLAVLAVGLGGTLSTLLEVLVQPAVTRSSGWLVDRLSLFPTLIVVGLPTWLLPWDRLQREARDAAARAALVRRIYLLVVFGAAVLTLLGSGAFAVYQVVSAALGEPWTAGRTSDLLTALSAAAVAGLLLAYHVRVQSHERAVAPQTPAPIPAPAVPAAPHVMLAVVRAPTASQLRHATEALRAHLPPDAELELAEVDQATAARLLALARGV